MAVAASDEDAEIAERLAALRERLTEVSAFTKHARESLTPARLQRARDEASSLSRTRREDAASPAGVEARRPGRALYFESADVAPRAHSRPSRSEPALDSEEPPLSPLRGHIRAARAFPDHHHRHHHEQRPSRRATHRQRRDNHEHHHRHSDLNVGPDPDRDPSVALGLDDDDDDDDDDLETRETRDAARRDITAVSAPAVSVSAPAISAVSAVSTSAAQSILERDRLHARVVRAEERAEAAAAEAALWRRRVDELERDARETRRRREDAVERLRRVAEDAATLAETTRARGGDGETVAAALETLAAALGGGTRGGRARSGDGGEPAGEPGAGPVLLLASSSVASPPSGRLALPAPRGVVAARAAAEARAAAAEVAGALEHALATAGCPSAAANPVRDALKQLTRKVDDAVVAAVGEGH
jgi:hypothetical protein